jgi:hypothetical protein
MGRGSSHVRQRDVARAVRGAMIGGLSVSKVTVEPDGRIVVTAGKPADSSPEDRPVQEHNEWDTDTP